MTAVHGKIKGGSAGSLVLRGSGDPSIRSADLGAMAAELKAMGLRRVDGDLMVDQGFFDDLHVPPAFEPQPGEWAWFRAPVSAVAVNGNTVTMHVRPGDDGEAASVWFEPPGFVDVEGGQTAARGAAQSVTLALEPSGKRLKAKVGGGHLSLPRLPRAHHGHLAAGSVCALEGDVRLARLVHSPEVRPARPARPHPS